MISIRVTILKDEASEGQYYVEFTKMEGDNIPYNKIYTEIKENVLHFAYEQPAYELKATAE